MRRRLAALALLAYLPLAACNESSDKESSGEVTSDATRPAKIPDGFREVRGNGFTLSAPAEFIKKTTQSSNGEPMLTLDAPSRMSGITQRVAVIRDVNPIASAEEQATALRDAKSAPTPESPATMREMAGEEGGSPVFLIQWHEALPDADYKRVDVTYMQLMYQASEGLILNVVGFAPTTEFEESSVEEILLTVDFTQTTAPL